MKKAFFALLFLFPTLVFAAGFAKESLFLSKSPVTEGETVLIHAVVANEKAEQFKGEVQLRSGDATIGSTPLTLTAGEARTVSVPWSPKAGTHKVTAELKTNDGTIAESTQATFVVLEIPKPAVAGTTTESTSVESSAQIQEAIENISPQVADGAQPVFETLDSWREKGAEFLDGQITAAKKHVPGNILGAETVQQAKDNPVGSVMTVFQTLYFYLLTILRYIIASAILSYPLLVVLFLWGLWKLYQRMSRPRY